MPESRTAGVLPVRKTGCCAGAAFFLRGASAIAEKFDNFASIVTETAGGLRETLAGAEPKGMENDDIEVIQINIHGEDKPGLTSSLTDILARYDAAILDIGQANIHQTLSMGILFKTDSIRSGDIMKDLLFKAYELGIQIRFQPITVEQYEQWVGMQGKNRYIITMLGRKLTAQQIAAVTRVVAEQGLNIDSILRLTGRVSLDENARAPKSCIELSVRGNPHDKEGMQSRFLQLSTELGMDISFQKDDMFRLKGLDESVMADIAERLPFTEGLDRLMHVLKRLGFKTAILSGGFTYFGNYLRRKYGFDYVYANELEIEDGKLTGRYLGDIVDGKRKAELLKLISQVENVDIAQTIAVGDGANDLPMLSVAGLGIAFHAKPKVKATAGQSLSTVGLDGILYFLGYKDSYIDDKQFKL